MSQRQFPDTNPVIPGADREPKHLALPTLSRRARTAIAAVPLVVVSSIAMSMSLVAPAHAEPAPKRVDKVRGQTTPKQARENQARSVRSVEIAPHEYLVVSEDTVSGIASRFAISTASILALNGLSWKSLIFPGQILQLSNGEAPSVQREPEHTVPITRYTVKEGDTVTDIAHAHNLDPATVLTANGLEPSSLIFPGQLIALPDTARPVAVEHPLPKTSSTSSAPGSHSTITPLTDEMREYAKIIIAVGHDEDIDDSGIIIALAAAMQESGLRNLRYGDRDSLGLFQQRQSTGWGTPEQILDPVTATRSFFGGSDNPHPSLTRGLLDVPDWKSLSLTEAAQSVQLSAHPHAYAQWEESARAWLTELG